MAKINAIGNISYLLLLLVFMVLSSTAGAVDITFYEKSACEGQGQIFANVAKDDCISNSGNSVRFSAMDDNCYRSLVYENAGCGSNPANSAIGNKCHSGQTFLSASWYNLCRRRSPFGDVTSHEMHACIFCMSKGNPSGVVYTEDSKKGTWVLISSNALEISSFLNSLPEAEKVNWMKDNGAVFDTSDTVAIA